MSGEYEFVPEKKKVFLYTKSHFDMHVVKIFIGKIRKCNTLSLTYTMR